MPPSYLEKNSIELNSISKMVLRLVHVVLFITLCPSSFVITLMGLR